MAHSIILAADRARSAAASAPSLSLPSFGGLVSTGDVKITDLRRGKPNSIDDDAPALIVCRARRYACRRASVFDRRPQPAYCVSRGAACEVLQIK